MKTLQELFDMAYVGLAGQGFVASQSVDGDCQYRGEGGRRCAFGFCIPDEDYDPTMEGKSASFIAEMGPLRTSAPEDVLDALQRCHDNSEDPADMRKRLHDFATHHSLTIPTVSGAA